MKDSARYIKIVEWSDDDGAFVGQCPGVIGPCCHGDDETAVYQELCQIVDEWIEIARHGTFRSRRLGPQYGTARAKKNDKCRPPRRAGCEILNPLLRRAIVPADRAAAPR